MKNELREALVYLVENENTLFEAKLSIGELELLHLIVNKARAALAAPPRNCDVGTPVEQRARFDKFCRSNSWDEIDGAHCMSSCPLYHGDCSRCEELEWAQMPYQEGGAS